MWQFTRAIYSHNVVAVLGHSIVVVKTLCRPIRSSVAGSPYRMEYERAKEIFERQQRGAAGSAAREGAAAEAGREWWIMVG